MKQMQVMLSAPAGGSVQLNEGSTGELFPDRSFSVFALYSMNEA